MPDALPPEMAAAARVVIANWELEPLTDLILQAVKPCLRFEFSYKPTETIVATFAGGYPEMPAGLEWPRFNGKRLPFVAQVNLAALPVSAAPALPRTGILYFFYWCTNEHPTCPCQVLWADCDVDVLQPMIVPEEEILADWGGIRVYEQIRTSAITLGASLSEGLLKRLLQQQNDTEIGDDDLIDFPEMFEGDVDLELAGGKLILTDHLTWGQSLGWLNLEMLLSGFTPTASGYHDGDDAWLNLLQVSSCGNMLWSDAGDVAFFIRERDLQSRNFSEVRAKILSS